MVTCYYYIIPPEDHDFLIKKLLAVLPARLQERLAAFKDKEEQLRSAAGKVLLMQLLNDVFPAGQYSIRDLQEDVYLRPYVSADFDFNIAHSGEMVVCAVSDAGKVGADVEWVRPVDRNDYQDLFTPGEWALISGSDHAVEIFFRFWTRKEALLKAIGKGLHISPAETDVRNDVIVWEGQAYHLHEIYTGEKYKACLASAAATEIRLQQVFL